MTRMVLILTGILVSAFLVGRVAGNNHFVVTAMSQNETCIAVCVANSDTNDENRLEECQQRCRVLH